jgi:hypothetical protein
MIKLGNVAWSSPACCPRSDRKNSLSCMFVGREFFNSRGQHARDGQHLFCGKAGPQGHEEIFLTNLIGMIHLLLNQW